MNLKQPIPGEHNSEKLREGDQGLVPHATISAKEVAGEVARGVKTVLGDAVVWAEKKAEELGEENDEGIGPYGSPATCIPSDLDPIASGVIPAMEAENVKEIQGDEGTKDVKKQQRPLKDEKK